MGERLTGLDVTLGRDGAHLVGAAEWWGWCAWI